MVIIRNNTSSIESKKTSLIAIVANDNNPNIYPWICMISIGKIIPCVLADCPCIPLNKKPTIFILYNLNLFSSILWYDVRCKKNGIATIRKEKNRLYTINILPSP